MDSGSSKEKGATQMQCLKLIMNEMNLSISEADDIVVNSLAWKAEKEGIEILRKNFLNALFLQDETKKDDDNILQ